MIIIVFNTRSLMSGIGDGSPDGHSGFTPVDIGDDNYTLSDKKFAVVMVMDVSGSMCYEIDAMTRAFNNFIEVSRQNCDVKNAVDIAIITFGTDVKNELNGFCDISYVPQMNFTCRGSTNMSEALRVADQMASDRRRLYKSSGIVAYPPWIVLMTDGYPDSVPDYEAVAETIKEKEDAGKVRVFAVGMGTGYNKELLRKLTDKCFSIDEWDFQQLFSWLGKSLAIVSQSRPSNRETIYDEGGEFQAMSGKFFDSV